MKFNKLNIAVLFLMTAFFAGCDDFDDKVESSPSYNDDSAVRFTDDNLSELYVNMAESYTFSLTVIRDNSTSALEVPVTVVTNTDDIFTFPSSISFGAGVDTVSMIVTMDPSATMEEAYPIELEFPDEFYSNPYKTEIPSYKGEVTMIKVCTLDGNSDLVGSWSGSDGFTGLLYNSQVVISEATAEGVTIEGLNFGWISGAEYWGEPITAGGSVPMVIDLKFGKVEIPYQYYFTTDYDGDPYEYYIEGSGTWDNCGDNIVMTIEYTLYNDTDGYELPSGTNAGADFETFTATLTLD